MLLPRLRNENKIPELDLEWKARVSVYPDVFASDHGRLLLEFLPTREEERGELPGGAGFRIASISELGLWVFLFSSISR